MSLSMDQFRKNSQFIQVSGRRLRQQCKQDYRAQFLGPYSFTIFRQTPRTMKKLLFFVAVLATISPAQADIIVTISEVGSDVHMTHAAGIIDTGGLTNAGGNTGNLRFYHGLGYIGGLSTSDGATWNGTLTASPSAGWTLPAPFNGTNWDSTSGTGGIYVGLFTPTFGQLGLPDGSVDGVNNIGAFTGVVAGQSFASLGLTAGESITYSWAADSVTFQTAATAVPEPSAAASMAVIGFIGLCRRRRR